MWQGISTITNNKQNCCPPSTVSPSLPDQLNIFFSRFESNNSSVRVPTPTPLTHNQHPSPSPSLFRKRGNQWHCTNTRLSRLSLTSTARSSTDGVPGRDQKTCVHQLVAVFTNIFIRSLNETTIPTCLNAATIIPITKCSAVTVDPWKNWVQTETPDQLLPVHHGKCPELCRHGVVLPLHLRGEEEPAVDHKDCTKNHWCPSARLRNRAEKIEVRFTK